MKIIFLILLLLAWLTSEHISQSPEEKGFKITVDEIEKMLVAFLKGFHIEHFTDATLPCKQSCDQFIKDSYEANDNFEEKQYFEALLDVTDVLGQASPVARNCTKSVEQMTQGFYKYVASFNSFEKWIEAILVHVYKNREDISVVADGLHDEYVSSNPNMTNVGYLVGELMYYTFNSESTEEILTYTKRDPLEPSPMNEYLFIALESLYELFTSSKLGVEEVLSDCEGALINMHLFHVDSYYHFKDQIYDESIFLALDSLEFLRSAVENCYYSGMHIYKNGTTVYEKIIQNPQIILDNLHKDLFHSGSTAIATYAQIYNRDLISLSRVFGGLFHKSVVQSTE